MWNDIAYLEKALNDCKEMKISLGKEYPLEFILENNDSIHFTLECYIRMIRCFERGMFSLKVG